MRQAIEQIEPGHLDWQEYERAARVNLKALKIQLRTCEDMIRTARQMMNELKDKSPADGDPELTHEEKEKLMDKRYENHKKTFKEDIKEQQTKCANCSEADECEQTKTTGSD